jgi:acyl-coenzyme A synthetase/AMP-(fatty) acid ligase
MIFKSQYNSSDLNAKHLSFVHARTCAGTLASFEAGMPMLSLSDPEPATLKRVMQEYAPTSLETHPNVFVHWESMADDPERPLGGVQRFISTFDAMHRRTVRRLFSATDVPGAHYLQAYGQTESGPICLRIVTRADVDSYSPRNVGHTGAGIEMRVVDPAGTPVAAGTVGSIETRSAGRMRGYVGGPAPTADDAWWPMGDLGRLLEDGSLELLDREVHHVDGVDSLLAAEDRLLEELPELVELVIVKTEADRLVAVACARPGAAGDSTKFREAAQRLGLGELPVRFWDWEALPLTGSYKVRRGVLRQRLSRSLGAAPADLSGR